MKRGAGLLALFAFLVTGLHFATGPAAVRETSEVKTGEKIGPAAAMPMRDDTSCEAFEFAAGTAGRATDQNSGEAGQIARLVERFLYGTTQPSRMAPGGLPEGIRLMVATIPDPVHTHLSLQFDRTLEAIQQAAQDERYTYDSAWLPWRTKNVEYSSYADRNAELEEAARREVCPGLILFRRNTTAARPENCKGAGGSPPKPGDAPYLCGMFVFVVSEKPTTGLNRVQWDNALHWIDQYAGKDRPDKVLRVLGPTFSGSMPSFVRALEDANKYTGTFSSTLLYSGRIRGCLSWRWLKRELNPPPGSGPAPTSVRLPVRLADFEENDALQTDRFYRYLQDRGHRLSEVTILSEDETAYGGLPDASIRQLQTEGGETSPCNPEYPQNDRPVHLYYPRDISAIRSAYQEQSIFAAGSKPSDGSAAPHTVLRQENAPDHNDTDTVEPFSGMDLALTQEAQLYGIVNTLKTHGTRYIVLRSTNSLDYLFLTRFLHRAYPMAYIVTAGSDLLFAREVDSTEFRGVVSLSSFPLLPRGQDWTRQVDGIPQHAHRVFGSYTMEGAYLAARFLITDPPVSPEEVKSPLPFIHPAKPDIPDYAPPFWDSPAGEGTESEPATWLAVIGRDGYWPLAVLRKTSGNSTRFSNLARVAKPPKAQQNGDGVPKEKLTLSSSWRLCCVLALLFLGIHFFACRFGWKRQDLGMFVQFSPHEGHRSPALIAAGWAAICSLLLMLFLASFRIYAWLGRMDRGWVWVTGLGTVAAFAFAALEIRWWQQPLVREAHEDPETQKMREAERMRRRFSPIWLALMFVVVTLFAYAAWLIFDFNQTDLSGVSCVYRSVHLTSGVSPVVSLLIMLAGFYWWFWQSLSGLALLGKGRPTLPRRDAMPGGLSQVSDLLAENIERVAMPFPHLTQQTILMYAVPLFLVVLLAFILQRAYSQSFDLVLHSLENTAFNQTLHLLIAIGLYLILLESGQFYATWLALKRLLAALNRFPIRRTFAAIQGLSMRSLWKLSGTSSRARYKIFAHQLECLRHLRNELEAFEWRGCATPALRHNVRASWAQGWQFVEERSKGPDVAMVNDDEALAVRVLFCGCAEQIVNELLVPEWLAERSSPELREPPAEGSAEERLPLSDNMPVRLAEEFLCLIYVGYLQNLLGRMRTMVLSMAGVFAAIALSVGFYPYTPRPTISLSLLVLLLVIGTVVGTVYAGLDRDSTLSHITNTEPGALSAHFWLRMLSFIGVPAMGLIVAQFPEITDFVFSWIAPTMNAMK